MRFYGHTLEDAPEEQWQPLLEHLEGTSRLAANFADRFGAGPWGRILGLLHDVGKYSTEFQKRLRGDWRRVDHSTAGAQLACKLYARAGRLLAYPVAGHHAGLPDGGSGHKEGDLIYRLADSTIKDYQAYQTEVHFPPPENLKVPIQLVPKQPGVSISMFIRMLFSSLVDADYLDTEAFMRPDLAKMRQGGASLAELLGKLEKRLEEIGRKASPSKVNQARKGILQQCREKAPLPPGMFTLTVPTGGGKTLSAMDFALRHGVLHGMDRVICVIPYTSIIEQNAAIYRDIFGDDNVLEHHSTFQPEEHTPAGQDPDETALRWKLAAENWDKPIIVTTNVQFFESLYANKSSRCRKLHNMANSVIILDEAQMMPDEYLKPCLAALSELVSNYGATVVLCTATQPAVKELLPPSVGVREIIDNPQDLYEALRRVQVRDGKTLDDDQLAEVLLQQPQALCIVNTRYHARNLYSKLGKEQGHWHLSALMCPKHRLQKLQEIRKALKEQEPCRVVATTLIEAGVDVDFPKVFRAFAGLDSIAQAAGRCNREGRLEKGDVTVFWPAEIKLKGRLARLASFAEQAWRGREDPLSIDAIEAFFTLRYRIDGSELDKQEILQRLDERHREGIFPFKSIAEDFKLIEDGDQVPIVIPYDSECEALLEDLEFGGMTASLGRRLQAYTVSVYRHEWLEYRNAKVVKTLDGLVQVLTDKSLYDDHLGLLPMQERSVVQEVLLV